LDELQNRLNEFTGTKFEPIERMRSLAKTVGCVGKQSGASGGDGALFVAPDVGAREAAIQLLNSRGFPAVALQMESGVRSEAMMSEALRSLMLTSQLSD
jgi:phosphomevalonate kinase